MTEALHNVPREKLREIIATHGHGLCDEPARCRGFLLDACSGYRREIRVLMLALEEHVVAALLVSSSSQVPYPLLRARLAKQLSQECSLTEEAAQWAVESWAQALGVYSDDAISEHGQRRGTQPRVETPLAWRAFGESVRGALHVRANIPNQDAILWQEGSENGLPLILAVADGHSGPTYYRSDRGAQFAVEAAVQEITYFVNALPTPLTYFGLVEHLAETLPQNIVANWHKRVETDLRGKIPVTQEEWQRLPEQERVPIMTAVITDPVLTYGSTLLTVLVTESFILYLQLGNGDILTVTEMGQATKPIPIDMQVHTNEITSLSSTNAAQNFRKQLHQLQGTPPALILLSTDSYAKSCGNEEDLLEAGSDILHTLHRNGVDALEKRISEWLNKASKMGSKDDITLGVVCRC